MMTYLLLNSVFLAVLCIVLRLLDKDALRFDKSWPTTIIVLFVLTAIFDSVIIGLGIVDYNRSAISMVYIWLAPIEDFFYPLAASIMIPALWKLSSRKNDWIGHDGNN